MYDVEVGMGFYLAGKTEDGTPYEAERYCACVVDNSGRRWYHKKWFNGCMVHEDVSEFGYDICFEDVRDVALSRVENLTKRIEIHLAEGKLLNFTQWYEVDPVYGSPAYISQGIEAQRLEKEKLEG